MPGSQAACRAVQVDGIPPASLVIDKDRFTSFLETAMTEMAPGIEDKRTLFSLRQLITALRAPLPSKAVQ